MSSSSSTPCDNIIPFPGNPFHGRVLQLRVELVVVPRPVWRVIQVLETATFWDLHIAIQDALGWENRHAHQFTVDHPGSGHRYRYGLPEDTPFAALGSLLPGWERSIAEFFGPDHLPALYTYDFGDDWQHEVALDKVLDRDPDQRYPRCVAGRGACPIEDCGGPPGYEHLITVLADRRHEEYADMAAWIEQFQPVESFDPDRFRFSDVVFSDPIQRWQEIFGEDD